MKCKFIDCVYNFSGRCYTPDKNYLDDFSHREDHKRKELRIFINSDRKVIAKLSIDFALKEASQFSTVLNFLRMSDVKYKKVYITRLKWVDIILISVLDILRFWMITHCTVTK